MFKRFMSSLIIFSIIFSCSLSAFATNLSNFSITRSYTEGQFSDVPSDAWYSQSIETAYKLNLLNGKTSTTFDPSSNITIAETIKLAVCIHSIYENGSVSIKNGTPWYQNYVSYAIKNNIIEGERSDYNAIATRSQFASILANAMPNEGFAEINNINKNDIPDISSTTSYADAVYKLYRAGIVTGSDEQGSFKPTSNITRKEVATIAARMADSSLRKKFSLSVTPLSAEQIFAQCSPAVFFIEVYDYNQTAIASGSGFFINASGTAVTNYHVIKGSSSAKIRTTDGKTYNVSGVYDYDTQRDLAILKINGSNFPYLEKAENWTINTGATVYAIGSPLGLENTISQGIVSNNNRIIQSQKYIQTTAAISHGSSGGALINTYGKVIGITSAGFTDGENLGLAIPINEISNLSSLNATKTLANITQNEATKTTNPSNSALTANKSSLTIRKGSTETITYTYSGNESVKASFKISNPSIVSGNWSNWNGDNVNLALKGISAGNTDVTVFILNSNDVVLAQKIIHVIVDNETSYSYYPNAYPAIDFGSFMNVEPYLKNMDSTNGIQSYFYRTIDLPFNTSYFEIYLDELKRKGFSYYDTFIDDDGYSVFIYKNYSYNLLIYASMVDLNGIPGLYIVVNKI